MKHTFFSMCVVVIAAGGVRAQPASPPVPSVDLKAMHEDIEILRRLLVKELGARRDTVLHDFGVQSLLTPYLSDPGYGAWVGYRFDGSYLPVGDSQNATNVARGLRYLAAHQATNNVNQYLNNSTGLPYPLTDIRDQSISFEGNYLKGHGVAYTASIPAANLVGLDTPTKSIGLLSGCAKCHEPIAIRNRIEPGKDPAPKPLSNWDRTRQEIQGKKEEIKLPTLKMQAQDICAPGTLTEGILMVLAENGHNFKQLTASEHISVAITISGTLSGAYRPQVNVTTAHSLGNPDVVKAAEDLVSVGDLHARQNKHATAVKNYADAIKSLEEKPITATSKAEEGANRLLRQTYAKYAQSLIETGKLVEARAALDKASVATVKVVEGPKSAQPKSTPAKLLITVSKKSMEEIHAGKIDMDQFRKVAEVQTVNLPAADKK